MVLASLKERPLCDKCFGGQRCAGRPIQVTVALSRYSFHFDAGPSGVLRITSQPCPLIIGLSLTKPDGKNVIIDASLHRRPPTEESTFRFVKLNLMLNNSSMHNRD